MKNSINESIKRVFETILWSLLPQPKKNCALVYMYL